MFALLLALFIVVPFVEISVIIMVANVIGGWNAIGLLLLVSLVGAWLTRHEGFFVVGRIRSQLDAGRLPTTELIDGGLVLTAGVLLLTPGFVTDAFGLFLLLPPTRALVRGVLKRRFAVRVAMLVPGVPKRANGSGPDDVIDV
jgi:UPF0716 protein FxsA